jgi:N-acetylgalactosamine-N,N'-diacetylbacillosaminyl-diphospho-undecaprenol 4-alpha-N-acetylgalactosaminyltransferase
MTQGRRPRLAILINSFRGGGAEKVASLLLQPLSEDYDVSLSLLSDRDASYPIPADQRIFILQGDDHDDWQNIVQLPALARQYHDYLVDQEIDISLTFLNRPNFINCMVKRRGWKGTTIISERAVSSQFYNRGVRKLVGGYLIRTLYPYADTIIPISRGVEHDLQHIYRVDAHYQTIYNPIDYATMRAEFEAQPAAPPEAPFTFVCVARFDPQKNHAMLVAAFARVTQPNTRLVLVGQGPELERIKQLARDHGVADRVDFVGFQRKPVVFLAQAHCFVLASDFEGLGNVLLEALACSRPIISTDCLSGPREILAPGTDYKTQLHSEMELAEYGILTPTRNVEVFAQAMTRMMTDHQLRGSYAAKAANRARMFDIAAVVQQYKSAIQAVARLQAAS